MFTSTAPTRAEEGVSGWIENSNRATRTRFPRPAFSLRHQVHELPTNTLPTGEVTFLFTDIEGSTRLWELHPDEMPSVIARHDSLMHSSIESAGGHVFKTVGDAFCAVFSNPGDAVSAAIDAQTRLAAEFEPTNRTELPSIAPLEADESAQGISLRVRMALHTGIAHERGGDYFGRPLNRIARLLSIAHGGQVILSSACAGHTSGLPPDVSLRDLGHHRLKDLLEPESVRQACHPDLFDNFPPLLSLRAYRHNLPCHSTSFVGREEEMEDVRDLVSRVRLVTLVGSGGTGKTRLSQQVAAELIDRYRDGVFLAELAPITDQAFAAHTVAACLEIPEEPGRDMIETLVGALQSKELLMLLDNCEHVIEEAARLCHELLRRCPGVRILATSREPLLVYGESTYRVPSLELPAHKRRLRLAEAADSSAVRLFLDRAEAAAPSFALTEANFDSVVQICRRLDGIPLALELAAARTRVMTPDQISQRLDNRFALLTRGNRTALPRQQTLRALIDWSWDLLADHEKILLRRLSVFAGGWTLEAAETVCSTAPSRTEGDEIDPLDLLDLLSQLVDKSLVLGDDRTAAPRFRLMETVRSYAAERLHDSGEEEDVRRCHLSWCMDLAERAEPHLDGPETEAWLNQLAVEHDNIRAALGTTASAIDRLRLSAAVHRFWLVRGFLREGRKWIEGALTEAGDDDTELRAKALNRAGILAWRQGDITAARPMIRASLHIWTVLGNRQGQASTRNNLGLIADDEGDRSAAREHFEEAVAIYRELGERGHVGMALANLASNLILQSDLDGAEAALYEFLHVSEEAQDRWCIATAHHNLAEVAFRRCDYGSALILCRKTLSEVALLRDTTQLMQLFLMAGQLVLATNEPSRATILLAVAGTLRADGGLYMSPHEIREFDSTKSDARAMLPVAEFAHWWELGCNITLEEALRFALDSDEPKN